VRSDINIPMDPLEQLLAERACERLIIDFVRRLDLGEPGSVAELFSEDAFQRRPDGTWLLSTRVLHLPFGGPTPHAGSIT
jgi:hypothetical protein